MMMMMTMMLPLVVVLFQGQLLAIKFDCSICMDVGDNAVLFPCGHGCCAAHVDDLTECACHCPRPYRFATAIFFAALAS